MKNKTKQILVATSAGILGMGVASALSLFVIIPLLKNTCTIFTGRCIPISYQKLPSGQILVKDPVLGLSYWYDGNFIRSYGVKLPGSCPSSVPIDANDVDVPVGDERAMCNHFAPDGVTCLNQSASETIPSQVEGTPQPSHTGLPTLETAFVMNAHTLKTSQQGVLCSRARNVVEGAFDSAPVKTIKTYIPRGTDGTMDVTQLFATLKNRGVFVPPATDPEPPLCNGNGAVDPQTALCVCDIGYTGPTCGTQLCASDQSCGDHGVCDAGLCKCDTGWGGDLCDQLACSPGCVNGACDHSTGTCVCDYGFEGPDCVNRTCLQNCVNGTCNPSNGVCECDEGWKGVACETRHCPDNCNGRGQCLESGECACEEEWQGVSCEDPVCPGNCSLNGVCNTESETCECFPGWTEADCSASVCARGCCSHGTCDPDTGTCTCIPGWGGVDCSEPDDPLSTAEHCPYDTGAP